MPHRLVDTRTGSLHILQVQPTPGDAVIAHPEDRHPALVKPGSVGPGSFPMPLGPAHRTHACRAEQLGAEVGDTLEDRPPVLPHLAAADERPVGVDRLLAAVLRIEARNKGVEVMPILGVMKPLKQLKSHCLPLRFQAHPAVEAHDAPKRSITKALRSRTADTSDEGLGGHVRRGPPTTTTTHLRSATGLCATGCSASRRRAAWLSTGHRPAGRRASTPRPVAGRPAPWRTSQTSAAQSRSPVLRRRIAQHRQRHGSPISPCPALVTQIRWVTLPGSIATTNADDGNAWRNSST